MDMLVIGGSRFVGPIIVEKLLAKNHKITVFNRGKIQDKYKKVEFIKGDRNKGFDTDRHFDVVIDTCAYTGQQTKSAIDSLDFDFFMNFGTAASYKKSEIFPLTEDSPIGDWPVWGDYNKGKVECENVLEKSGISFATIRPVYILGPKNYCDRENFICSRIKNNKPLTLPGNGQALVQFVFAKDVAESIVLLVEKRLEGNFNCAGNETITLKGLVHEMGKIVGKEPVIKFNASADGENHKESEFPFANENFFCTNNKLKRIGIKFTPLAKGLKEDYESYYKKLI
ncbi:MAG: NAD-dependent epimerase/dehydratase family protein [Candidatus Aenigmarchaeota archaeon]|nr:NAD-dependent epimerase/dehydratase family protein [Candidatus Aenigmarchaeota archaeon]